MPLPYDPRAAAAGLHPNWRTLGLGHIRQLRLFLRGRPRPGDSSGIETRRLIKQAQAELAGARRRYLAVPA